MRTQYLNWHLRQSVHHCILSASMENTDISQKQTTEVKILHGDSITELSNHIQKYNLIYLDPPYDTGRVFTISHSERLGFDDCWSKNEYIDWLDSLIQSCKARLESNGVLCLHISAENSFVAELVLNKHFKNINKIFWKRCHGKNTVKNKLGAVIDIIFECCDGKKKFNLIKIPLGETVWAFKNKDTVGNYSLGALKHDKTRNGHHYTIEHDGVIYETKNGWKIEESKMHELIAQNRVHYSAKAKMLYRKLYEHEHEGKPLSNMWDDIHSITRTTKDPRLYPTQKPYKLLERIISLYTDKGDWVLDPVAGSGTTGFVAKSMLRNVTLIDKNIDAIKIIKNRLVIDVASSELNNIDEICEHTD